MSQYLKFIVPLVAGLAVVVVGFLLPNADLVKIGVGAVGAAFVALSVPNTPYPPPAARFDPEPEAHPEGQTQLP